ncbi:MAG TPA: prolipoprotein diacylglyceryl transferase family protein [Chloroflexota bacterium]|nr:prolipoprotein diacylglyceryl transferase family protein [Chloroflexota bacterium]
MLSFLVQPYLVTVAGYPIPTFAVALDAALAIGLIVALRLAAARGVPTLRALDVALWVLPAALVGARSWYVVRHWPEYAAHPPAILALWEGGLSLTGAVAAGALAIAAVARAVRWTGWQLADGAAIGAALGQAIGRLGCVPAGCAAGRAATELPAWLPALSLPDASGLVAPRFPSQLAESLADGLLALALWRLWRARWPAGRVALAYLAGYCLIRAAAQPFRA